MNTPVQPLLQLRSITHAFAGLQVLRNVSFDIHAGAITCLVGPNGAGKSTLFNIISGFLQPSGGSIAYGGGDITAWNVTRRSRAGLVRTFQTPQVFAHMTVLENLMAAACATQRSSFVASLFNAPSARRDVAAMRAAARETCQAMGLADIADEPAGLLPAGQQRLVELARACVTRPRLLCLDEPSSGLNVQEVEALRAGLRKILQAGTSILLVSHDMDLVRIGSVVHVLCFGEIISSGSFGDIAADPRVREAYLGV
ncbi:ABC transporter ATP-binding protein [Variovorax sp. GB1P17]|uniref:ABC transporter ATP-binding protein n=1 Tax=Variovorax sp. GB1P17 TaxID=3443740 RepID=UPI003F452B4E